MNNRTFEEEIRQNGYLVYTNVGASMMPLLRQNRDLMVIEQKEGRWTRCCIKGKMGNIFCTGFFSYRWDL